VSTPGLQRMPPPPVTGVLGHGGTPLCWVCGPCPPPFLLPDCGRCLLPEPGVLAAVLVDLSLCPSDSSSFLPATAVCFLRQLGGGLCGSRVGWSEKSSVSPCQGGPFQGWPHPQAAWPRAARPVFLAPVQKTAWRSAWPVEHTTLDLRVASSSPTLGVEITLKK